MEDGKLYCRGCKKTKDATEFYDYSPRKCKECHRNKPNPKATGRNPEIVTKAWCLGKCGLELPNEKFDISDKTKLLMDKCKLCKILYRKGGTPPSTPERINPTEVKNDDMIVEGQLQITRHFDTDNDGKLSQSSDQDRQIYLQLETWMRAQNLTKESYAKVADIALRLAI